MLPLRSLLLASLTLAAAAVAAAADQAAPANSPPPAAASTPKARQFIYVLKLVPRLHDDNAWTDADKAVLQRHVANFKAAVERGQLILAGRTLEPGKDTFGLAIFNAAAAVRLPFRVCSIHKTPRSMVNSMSCMSR